MLSGNTPTVGHTTTNNLAREFLRLVLLTRDTLIVEHQWMQVPIASVKDISDTQTRTPTELLDLAQYLRQGGTWDHAILDDIVGADSTHCCKGFLATFPHQRAFLIGAGQSVLHGTRPAADRLHPVQQLEHF